MGPYDINIIYIYIKVCMFDESGKNSLVNYIFMTIIQKVTFLTTHKKENAKNY